MWRFASGDYRAIYAVSDAAPASLVVRIAPTAERTHDSKATDLLEG